MFNTKNLTRFAMAFVGLAALLIAIVPTIAQDGGEMMQDDAYAMLENPDPLADAVFGEAETATIQSVTTSSDDFYGSVVTLEGEIGEFINVRAFALGESAAIDNDLVLVVNNSSQDFDPRIVMESFVRVTGRVHPSIEAIENGAQTDFGALFTDDGMYMAQSDAQSRPNMLDFYYSGWLPNGFNNYTVIEVLNVENVEFLELGQDEIGN